MKTSKITVRTKSGLKAGGLSINHNRGLVKAKSGAKAGGLSINHNRGLV